MADSHLFLIPVGQELALSVVKMYLFVCVVKSSSSLKIRAIFMTNRYLAEQLFVGCF